MKWLIADDVAREMRARISAGLATSPEVQGAFAEAVAELEAAVGAPRNLTVAGDIAQVGVEGLLTERPDFLAWLMGYANTTYSSIQQALAMADADPAVKRIELKINSPGGTVAGLFETLGAIEDTQKPISVTTSYAASAAYAIAARGGRITALTGATEVGSIGVAQSFYAPEEIIDVASTAAPKKRPDVRTEEGRAIVRERLDALHEQFVKAIAGGRGTTVENVNTNFGQGGVLVAVEAK
jgi:ClpP class serine protease